MKYHIFTRIPYLYTSSNCFAVVLLVLCKTRRAGHPPTSHMQRLQQINRAFRSYQKIYIKVKWFGISLAFFIINRTLHDLLEIGNFSSRAKKIVLCIHFSLSEIFFRSFRISAWPSCLSIFQNFFHSQVIKQKSTRLIKITTI